MPSHRKQNRPSGGVHLSRTAHGQSMLFHRSSAERCLVHERRATGGQLRPTWCTDTGRHSDGSGVSLGPDWWAKAKQQQHNDHNDDDDREEVSYD